MLGLGSFEFGLTAGEPFGAGPVAFGLGDRPLGLPAIGNPLARGGVSSADRLVFGGAARGVFSLPFGAVGNQPLQFPPEVAHSIGRERLAHEFIHIRDAFE